MIPAPPDPGEPPPVAALVARAAGGDARAFRELYERHVGLVHAVLLGHAPPAEADDLVQEVFLVAWRDLARLRAREHVGSWLAGVARNLAREARRRRARDGAEPLSDDVACAPDDPADGEAERALAALRELPATYRETLAMRLVEGMTGPEIAAATGRTHGSVRVHLTRGMKLLRERLSREVER